MGQTKLYHVKLKETYQDLLSLIRMIKEAVNLSSAKTQTLINSLA